MVWGDVFIRRYSVIDKFRMASAIAVLVFLAACGDGTRATPTATSAQATTAAACDDSYPDVCIAPYPPDLDCRQIPHRRFRVLQPDPHRFDQDRDGIGCEAVPTGTNPSDILPTFQIIPPPTAISPPRPVEPPQTRVFQSCCKHCSKGKACGNSCISRSYTCRKGPGCACNR